MSLFLLYEDSSEVGSLSEITFDPDSHSRISKNCYNNSKLYSQIGGGGADKATISCKTKVAWSFVLIIMASFFLAAAYVQHNDPDPYIWMPAYLVPFGVNCAVILFALRPTSSSYQTSYQFWKIINWTVSTHICYCYILGFWTLGHYVHRQMLEDDQRMILTEMVSEPNMQMEEAKELIGLCLVIAWLSFVNHGNFLRFGKKGIIFASFLTALPIVSWVLVEKVEETRDEACF